MSDPLPLTVIAEETPSGSVSRAASHPTLFNIDSPSSQNAEEDHHASNVQGNHLGHPDHSPPPPVTPKLGNTRARSGSSVSRVDVEFFDPEGVQALRRTMTKEANDRDRPSVASSSSDHTLTDEPFDFEKTVRHFVRRYVSNLVPSNTEISYHI
jgi:ATP-binding cassette subfamily G (WHITE) protein 2 (SNQ2)